ncbi:4a-hydroxytetrahydrobiopterin dehydratase [Szabonella alba]|uniref:Putative pterin-4-alpha-carbinolamine dehydratase n=1 Tax=Szabonella alba TaxID=2804194 RepID=A0A8K0V941_9RHOB|nr:4a-hydroxytetrahydrobiopterin dehydratase [Szabonella alba]MBL4915943.1 4a-hydroxytetrahydrobiopterin dehydratase [Szabonella alba]
MKQPDYAAPDPAALEALLAKGWALVPEREAITRSYRFADFAEAMGFMMRAAIWAEKLNHHPEWSNTYHRVEVTLTTHAIAGLSDLDILLAERMDRLAGI